MSERRVDRIKRHLREKGGRARLQDLLEDIRAEDPNPDLSYQSVYIAIQSENQRLQEQGERPLFETSREGEKKGWVRLRETSDVPQDSVERDLVARIQEANVAIREKIRKWLEGMDWRTFESTFLKKVLEALGFQDVEITRSIRDGGQDARVTYRRGIVEAQAIVSAKKWKAGATVGVGVVRELRGSPGDEDTAIIVTTGQFSTDAEIEAKQRQLALRNVYLIDGDELVDICVRQKIGIKEKELPKLLVFDPELAGEPEAVEGEQQYDSEPRMQRLRDEMLGDSERGLSVEETAELSGLAVTTVRQYLLDDRRKVVGDKIRANEQARDRALTIISGKRSRQ
jgi:restriction endonuclease Mrr